MCPEGQRHIGERVKGAATHTPVSVNSERVPDQPGSCWHVSLLEGQWQPLGPVSWSPFIKPQARLAQQHSAPWPHTDLGSSGRLRNESLCVHSSFQGSGCVLPFPPRRTGPAALMAPPLWPECVVCF